MAKLTFFTLMCPCCKTPLINEANLDDENGASIEYLPIFRSKVLAEMHKQEVIAENPHIKDPVIVEMSVGWNGKTCEMVPTE